MCGDQQSQPPVQDDLPLLPKSIAPNPFTHANSDRSYQDEQEKLDLQSRRDGGQTDPHAPPPTTLAVGLGVGLGAALLSLIAAAAAYALFRRRSVRQRPAGLLGWTAGSGKTPRDDSSSNPFSADSSRRFNSQAAPNGSRAAAGGGQPRAAAGYGGGKIRIKPPGNSWRMVGRHTAPGIGLEAGGGSGGAGDDDVGASHCDDQDNVQLGGFLLDQLGGGQLWCFLH